MLLKVNKRTQELIQPDPLTPKGKTDKYNKSAAELTDGKQRWQLFSLKKWVLYDPNLTEHSINSNKY